MNFTERMLDSFEKAGVKLTSGVADSWVAGLLERLESSNTISHVPAAREEDALGICCGAVLSGARAVCIMQNAGALNCGGPLATLAVLYGVPLVLVVADRGHLGDESMGHFEKARVFRHFLDALGISYYDLSADFHARNQVEEAFQLAEAGQKPIALLKRLPWRRRDDR